MQDSRVPLLEFKNVSLQRGNRYILKPGDL
jgi:hypothetical protein